MRLMAAAYHDEVCSGGPGTSTLFGVQTKVRAEEWLVFLVFVHW